ncbi:YaaC family protein [Streptomyces sp. NPDC049541]|uniref:YaaC family protein n=1 Tax=Streptomyces sp. NPDC049541 TaxID=3365594 RepID=UPI0037A00E94
MRASRDRRRLARSALRRGRPCGPLDMPGRQGRQGQGRQDDDGGRRRRGAPTLDACPEGGQVTGSAQGPRAAPTPRMPTERSAPVGSPSNSAGQPPRGTWEAEIGDFFDIRTPAYRFTENRYLRPAFEPTKAPPRPLMTWWLLLDSFSTLARYQPRKWSEALDIDKSPGAAALEYALDIALGVSPHLVLEELDRKPVLLAQTMTF